MGRASKFSFPFPGRKAKAPNKEEEYESKPIKRNSSYLPKAQRILGTSNVLNIDSPARDDRSWGAASSRSSVSGMSISVSESTRSAHDGASVAETNTDRWELESGVLPRYQRLRGRPSSTLLGLSNGDEPGTADTSSPGRPMQHGTSTPTLRSYYDRQKSPLAVSQQTSASSARDLALRKGHPPAVPRTPQLQVDQAHERVSDSVPRVVVSPAKPWKKVGRLELMTLFPRSRSSSPATAPPTPYGVPTNQPHISQAPHSAHEDRRPKASPTEAWQTPIRNSPSGYAHGQKKHHTDNTPGELYYRNGDIEIPSPRMANIPESKTLDDDKPMSPTRAHYKLDGDRQREHSTYQSGLQTNSADSHTPLSWRNMRTNMANRTWETSSATSASSRNTKTSRHTSLSLLSASNLKVESVLSLSSESEDEVSDHVSSRRSASSVSRTLSRTLSRAASQRTYDSSRRSPQPAGSLPRVQESKRASAQVHLSLTIPDSPLPGARISDPRSRPDLEVPQPTRSRSSGKRRTKGLKAPPSISPPGQLTPPPLSPVPPIPAEYRDDGARSSRLMAVTEQEVALLEALRQKKARMREEIIEEHETMKSPPRASRTKNPRLSEVAARGASASATESKERPHLHLDTPLSNGRLIDPAEPSPDLSDFLSFGSDEESTPRSSWAMFPNSQLRIDSPVSPNTRQKSLSKSQKKSPMTPPNAARLSAVGALTAFPGERPQEADPKTKLSNVPRVQVLDERRFANELLMDEQDDGVAWAT